LDEVSQGQIVYKGQEVLHVDFVVGLQSAQRGAVLEIILFTHLRDLCRVEAHMVAHVEVHALFNSMPQSGGGGIERIVEIEENGRVFHRILKPEAAGLRSFQFCLKKSKHGIAEICLESG